MLSNLNIKTPALVGILNVTPDSFSREGCLAEYDWGELVQQAWAAGADYLDIGAEATSPGSQPLGPEVEQARLEPVWAELKKLPIAQKSRLSCDTRHASTAVRAIQTGVTWINDVSGGRADPHMWPTIAEYGVRYVMMYARCPSGRADLRPLSQREYAQSMLGRIQDFFDAQLPLAYRAGIRAEQLILDPGMGAFISPEAADSVALLQQLSVLKARYQLPLYVGVSRKGFLSRITSFAPEPNARLGASLAAAWWAVQQGVDYVRIHDIRDTRQFFETLGALSVRQKK